MGLQADADSATLQSLDNHMGGTTPTTQTPPVSGQQETPCGIHATARSRCTRNELDTGFRINAA